MAQSKYFCFLSKIYITILVYTSLVSKITKNVVRFKNKLNFTL